MPESRAQRGLDLPRLFCRECRSRLENSQAAVFVLPNRDTYYDLVLLEVMSAGIPIIASHTGGNISVQKMVPALRTYQNQEAGIVQEIEKLYRMTEEQRKTIGTELKKSYEENFTIERFAQRYMETIQKIYRDYDLD